MKRLLGILTSAVALVTVVAPIAHSRPADDRRDRTIEIQVKTKFVGKGANDLDVIGVDSRRGVVHLRGIVYSERDKAEAERLARATGGVVDVKSHLRVDPKGARESDVRARRRE